MSERARSAALHRRVVQAALAGFVLVAVGAGQGWAGESAAGQLPTKLPDALRMDRIRADLRAVERIADANGGNRKAGSPGYAASVRYVRGQLRRAGYQARALSFPFVEYDELVERARQLTPRRRSFRVEAVDYSPSTPAGGVRGRIVAADDGCEASDFDSARGRIAIARRGTCFTAFKAQNAAEAGALALVVFNVEAGPVDSTLGDPRASPIPVAAVERATAKALIASGRATIELTIRTRRRPSTSQNVVADARPNARRVLLVGAHLDSVVMGAGVNDNGTGVAVLLEIARALRQLAPQLPVRFAFWGAEEFGLIGSSAYARTADRGEIAAYLNFDMLGSRAEPRAREVYSGSFAARWLEYFEDKKGLRAEVIDLSGRSDHAAFAQLGIPTGGLFAGIDRCYHARCDRLANVDFTILRQLAAATAFGVAEFSPPA